MISDPLPWQISYTNHFDIVNLGETSDEHIDIYKGWTIWKVAFLNVKFVLPSLQNDIEADESGWGANL